MTELSRNTPLSLDNSVHQHRHKSSSTQTPCARPHMAAVPVSRIRRQQQRTHKQAHRFPKAGSRTKQSRRKEGMTCEGAGAEFESEVHKVAVALHVVVPHLCGVSEQERRPSDRRLGSCVGVCVCLFFVFVFVCMCVNGSGCAEAGGGAYDVRMRVAGPTIRDVSTVSSPTIRDVSTVCSPTIRYASTVSSHTIRHASTGYGVGR